MKPSAPALGELPVVRYLRMGSALAPAALGTRTLTLKKTSDGWAGARHSRRKRGTE